MTADIAELKQELRALQSQFSGHAGHLREISSVLNTVSSTLASANQISAHERENLLERLGSINDEIIHERRTMTETMNRIERAVDDLDGDFEKFIADRDEVDGNIVSILRRVESIYTQFNSTLPTINECLRHTRKLVSRDPDTGAEIAKADQILTFLAQGLFSALATAFVLLMLSRIIPFLPHAVQQGH